MTRQFLFLILILFLIPLPYVYGGEICSKAGIGKNGSPKGRLLVLLEKLERPEGYVIKKDILDAAEKEGIAKLTAIQEIKQAGYVDERVRDKEGKSLVVVRERRRDDSENEAAKAQKRWPKEKLRIRRILVANAIPELINTRGRKPSITEITEEVNKKLPEQKITETTNRRKTYDDIKALNLEDQITIFIKDQWTEHELRVRRTLVANAIRELANSLGRKPYTIEIKEKVNEQLPVHGITKKTDRHNIIGDVENLNLRDIIIILEKETWTKDELQIRRELVAEAIPKLISTRGQKPSINDIIEEVNKQLPTREITKKIDRHQARIDIISQNLEEMIEKKDREGWTKYELRIRRTFVANVIPELTYTRGRKPSIKDITETVNKKMQERGITKQSGKHQIRDDIALLNLEEEVIKKEQEIWTIQEIKIRRTLVVSTISELTKRLGRKPYIGEITEKVNEGLPALGVISKKTSKHNTRNDIKQLNLDHAVTKKEQEKFTNSELRVRRTLIINIIPELTETRGRKPSVKEVIEEVNKQLPTRGITKKTYRELTYMDIRALNLEDQVVIRQWRQ